MTFAVNKAVGADVKFAQEVTNALCAYLQSGDDKILSKYKTSRGAIVIETEPDRSVTTIMFEHEY